MWIKIKYWFLTKKDLIKQMIEVDDAMSLMLYNHAQEIKQLKHELIYKVSQSRAAEILAIKPLESSKEMGAMSYKEYLAEAESIYRLRPWRDIINKFQHEQVQYVMTKSDGGEVGQLQQLVSRGGILFADYAEQEMKKLHISHLEVVSGSKELNDDEKYSIFT